MLARIFRFIFFVGDINEWEYGLKIPSKGEDPSTLIDTSEWRVN